MKTIRKGLGLGKGKGYYNLVQRDPYIHSLSARGVKTFSTLYPKIKEKMIKNENKEIQKKKAEEREEEYLKEAKKAGDYPFDEYYPMWYGLQKTFSKKELKVLKQLNYEYYPSQNQWGLKHTKQPSELFVVETQLGISSKQAKDLVMRYLSVLEKYPYKEGLQFMGFTTPKHKYKEIVGQDKDGSKNYMYVMDAKGENVTIVKGVNGWRIENDKGEILIDRVFNNQWEAFAFYKQNLKKKLDAKSCNIVSHLKHSKVPDYKFDKEQLRKGIKVELEHTNSKKVAKAIAKAHLTENKFYYTYLEEMEKKMDEQQSASGLWTEIYG